MALPNEMEKIKKRIESKGIKRSKSEGALLTELVQIEKGVTLEQLREVNANVTKMTGPDEGICSCCGRPL